MKRRRQEDLTPTWTQFGSRCFKRVVFRGGFTQAWKACQNLNSTQALITSHQMTVLLLLADTVYIIRLTEII